MPKVYVGAKFEQAGEARATMKVLRDAGYEITHDWTTESIAGLRGKAVLELLSSAAVRDMDGVRNADAMVLLHHPALKGGLCEAGGAVIQGKPLIVVGADLFSKDAKWPIFYFHPGVIHVANVDAALDVLELLFDGEARPQQHGDWMDFPEDMDVDPAAPEIVDPECDPYPGCVGCPMEHGECF